MPSTSTYTTVQTSKYSSHQTVESAAASEVPAQAPPSDIGLAGVIAVLCSGTDMYKYKSGAGRRRHIRHFQIRGIGEDAALTWRSPGWLSLRKERSVLLRDVVAMHHARGDLEWLRFAAPDHGCASRARFHAPTRSPAPTPASTPAAGTPAAASPVMHTASRSSIWSLIRTLLPIRMATPVSRRQVYCA